MAGFEMVKELDVDFTFYHIGKGFAHFNWFFGLINDCNNIEKLSLNGLMFPFVDTTSYFRYFLASIKEKFKNLKKCQISFQEGFEPYFKNISSGYAGLSWRQYAAELTIPQDELYMDTLAENLGAKYLVFVSSRFVKMRELSFAQFG